MCASNRAEFFGILTLAGKVVAWLPGILFAAANEATGSLDLAVASMALFHFVGLVSIFVQCQQCTLPSQ